MNRPILSMWPYLGHVLGVGVVYSCQWILCVKLTQALGGSALELFASVALCPLILGLLFWWRFRWLWRFGKHVRGYGTIKQGRVVLHYASELAAIWDLAELSHRCQAELDQLKQRFGFPLRRRVVVYLFPRWQDIAKIFGARFGGAALSTANVIVIADDNNVIRSMRHELAHLFSLRWNTLTPPLLSEGLSVWCEGGDSAQSTDSVARRLLTNRSLKLSRLLDPAFFFSDPYRHDCYALAGSFTGFLIRRYGWERYERLYRCCNGYRFKAKFNRCFGVTFEKAEWQWRNELILPQIFRRRLKNSFYL